MTNQDWVDVGVFRLPMAAPEDVSGLKDLLASGQVQADSIVGIIAQT
ncbi:MAG: ring-opening amidohydrolase, partial [Cyanobacteria bacterium J06638_6]